MSGKESEKCRGKPSSLHKDNDSDMCAIVGDAGGHVLWFGWSLSVYNGAEKNKLCLGAMRMAVILVTKKQHKCHVCQCADDSSMVRMVIFTEFIIQVSCVLWCGCMFCSGWPMSM